MNLNKNFLTEVIKYLISKEVTVHDVLDAFHNEFECREQLQNRQDELRKGDLHLLLCGKSVEESSTPCEKVDVKPVTKSWIDYPKNIKNHGNGVSPARKALFDVVGDKTVIEHLRANGIDYKVYDNRVRRKWSVAEACTTPLAPRGKGKRKRVIEEPGESEEPMAVIIPDTNVKCLESEKITGTKKRMMLLNGRMTEVDVSDTDLVQSSIEKPVETLETQTETLETKSNTEKATESVTNATALNGNNVTAVILDTPNPDAIHKDKDHYIEKALKKFITSTTGIEYEEPKKDKKPKEPKKDYTFSDLCLKLSLTTHELKKMISTGEFPQPDCGNKWSVKLLKDKNLI